MFVKHMEDRNIIILDKIIDEHISTGQPVGSSSIVKKYNLNISPATVRNIMAELEERGYIAQPHTSAGRVPTEKAYRYYISKINTEKLKPHQKLKLFDELIGDTLDHKKIAKLMAEYSSNTVFWASHKNNLFYTGISNLFQQPEFSQIDMIYSFSNVVDRFDEIIDDIFERIDYGHNVLLGSDNPFGAFCGTIIAKYKQDDKTGLFGLLGPIRMNYKDNLTMVDYINKKINTYE